MAIIEITTASCRPERLLLSHGGLSLVALGGRRLVQFSLILHVDGSNINILHCSWPRESSFDRRFKVSMEKTSEVGPVKDILGFSWLDMFGLLEIEGAL